MITFNPNDDIRNRNPLKADESINHNVLLQLVSVNVESKEQSLDSVKATEMQSEYSGHNVPRIYFEFKQMFLPGSLLHKEGKDRFYVYTESPIVSFMNAKNPGEERNPMEKDVLKNLYTEQFKHLMEIYNAFKLSPNFRPIKSEFNLNPDTTIEARLNLFTDYFNTFAIGINGKEGEKPAFVDGNNQPIPLIAKVIVNKGGKRLEFPTYTGSGFIEGAKIINNIVVNTFDIKPNETTNISEVKKDINSITGGMPPGMQAGLKDLIDNA
jgi:hypothetical protein